MARAAGGNRSTCRVIGVPMHFRSHAGAWNKYKRPGLRLATQAFATFSMKTQVFSADFTPGADSTPLLKSMA